MTRRILALMLLATALMGAGWRLSQPHAVLAQTEVPTAEATADPLNPSVAVDWQEWSARIIVQGDGSLDVVEKQTITVTSGAIRFGRRSFFEPITLNAAYVTQNGQARTALTDGAGLGTYQVTEDDRGPSVVYQLFETANAGDTFTVELAFTVAPAVPGALDWYIVPQGHDFPVQRATATIFFADNLKPSKDQIATSGAEGHFLSFGKAIFVVADSAIPAGTPFEVNIPYQSDRLGTTF